MSATMPETSVIHTDRNIFTAIAYSSADRPGSSRRRKVNEKLLNSIWAIELAPQSLAAFSCSVRLSSLCIGLFLLVAIVQPCSAAGHQSETIAESGMQSYSSFIFVSTAAVIGASIVYFAYSSIKKQRNPSQSGKHKFKQSYHDMKSQMEYSGSKMTDFETNNDTGFHSGSFPESPRSAANDSAIGDQDVFKQYTPLAASTPLNSPSRTRIRPISSEENMELHSLAKIATLEELSITTVDPTAVNSFDSQHRTPLHIAIEWNNISAAKFLLDHGALPSIPNSEGLDAVHLASRFKRASILKILMDKKAQCNVKVLTTKWTPLHFAACVDGTDVAEILLKSGADPNSCDIWLETPLHKAAAEGGLSVARLLISHGAQKNVKNTKDETPYDTAIRRAHDKVADILKVNAINS